MSLNLVRLEFSGIETFSEPGVVLVKLETSRTVRLRTMVSVLWNGIGRGNRIVLRKENERKKERKKETRGGMRIHFGILNCGVHFNL